jgi:hypothetical protein
VRRGVEASIVLLPVLCALTAYSLGLRIDQYGLSPDRFYVAVLASVLGLYALGCAAAVFVSGPVWMGSIRPLNIALAWVVIAVALALHGPLLDPLYWSARNQYQRLVTGRVSADTFDFAYMRFQLGDAGSAWLQRIAALESHPELDRIREQVALARALKRYEGAPRGDGTRNPLTLADLELIGGLNVLPPGLLATLDEQSRDRCHADRPCALFAVDVTGDPTPEYCLDTGYFSVPCFAQRPGRDEWRKLGELPTPGGLSLSMLRHKGARTEPSAYRDVRIGEQLLRLTPAEP